MGKAIIELGVTDAALQELRGTYLDKQWDCSDKEQYEEVRKGVGQLRTLRNKVEKRRKELKAPLVKQGKDIDVEAKRVIGALVEIEDPLKEAKAVEDERIERARQAELQREMDRNARINKKLAWIADQPRAAAGCSSDEIMVILTGLNVCETADCDERKAVADELLEETLEKVRGMHAQALELEDFKRKQAEMAKQQAEIDRQKAEIAEKEKKPQERNPFEETAPVTSMLPPLDPNERDTSPFSKPVTVSREAYSHPVDEAIKEVVEVMWKLEHPRDFVIAVIDGKVPHITWTGPR